MSDNSETGEFGDDVELPTIIIVNTKPKKVAGEALTFEQVTALYEGPALAGPNVEFTVTYRKGPAANPQGNLYAGQTVNIQAGMIFNVTPTDKS